MRRLVHEAILRFLTGRGYLLWRFDPAVFVYRRPQQDLLAMAAAAAGVPRISWLHAYPEYKVVARAIRPRDASPIIGVLVDVHSRFQCDLSSRDLIQRGADLRGRYVCESVESRRADVRLDPRASRRLAGRVEEFTEDALELRRGTERVRLPIDRAWPEERRESLRALAIDLEGDGAAAVLRELDAALLKLVSGRGRLDRTRAMQKLLITAGPLILAADLTCTIKEPMAPAQGSDAGGYTKLTRPTYVFDQAATKTHEWPNRGLQQFGPFDAESFVPKRPHIALIVPKEFQGDAEVFVKMLRDGIPNDQTYPLGLVRQYHLDGCTFDVEAFNSSGYETRDYRDACLRCLSGPSLPT